MVFPVIRPLHLLIGVHQGESAVLPQRLEMGC